MHINAVSIVRRNTYHRLYDDDDDGDAYCYCCCGCCRIVYVCSSVHASHHRRWLRRLPTVDDSHPPQTNSMVCNLMPVTVIVQR